MFCKRLSNFLLPCLNWECQEKQVHPSAIVLLSVQVSLLQVSSSTYFAVTKRCLLLAKILSSEKEISSIHIKSFLRFQSWRSWTFYLKGNPKLLFNRRHQFLSLRRVPLPCIPVLFFFFCDSVLWVQLINSGDVRSMIRNTKPRCWSS